MAFDLDSRIPCLDDACTGVLDPHGRCGTCGRQSTPEELAAAGAAAARPADDGAPDADDGDDGGERAASSGAGGTGSDDDDDAAMAEGQAAGDGGEEPAGDFDAGRRLCADGACIGVIGPDNRCKVCGLAADPQASAE